MPPDRTSSRQQQQAQQSPSSLLPSSSSSSSPAAPVVAAPSTAASSTPSSTPTSPVTSSVRKPSVSSGSKTTTVSGKKKEPTATDPGAIYESLQQRIAALEVVEHGEEEEERRSAAEARKSAKEASDLESKYIDLFQEMKKQQRLHEQERGKLIKDKDISKSALSKANVHKTKLEDFARTTQKDNKRLRDEVALLSSQLRTARETIEKLKHSTSSSPSSLAAPQASSSTSVPSSHAASSSSQRHAAQNAGQALPLTDNARPEEVTILVSWANAPSSVGSAPVPFKIPRALPLSRVLSAFISHVSSKLSPSSTPSVSASSTTSSSSSSSSSKARKAASLATPSPSAATISSNTATHNTPDFILTHPSAPNFLPLSPALTVDEAHLDEGDVLLAIEIMDLTSLFFPEASSSSAVLDGAVSTASTLTAPTTPSSKTSKRTQSSAGRKREAAAAAASAVPAVPSTPLSSSAEASLAAAHEWARTLISNTMETAVRERLKGVLKQYEARERQFEAVLRSKELEILLAKARSEEAKLRADEAHLDAEQWEAETARNVDMIIAARRDATALHQRYLDVVRQPPSMQQLQALVGITFEEEQLTRQRIEEAVAASGLDEDDDDEDDEDDDEDDDDEEDHDEDESEGEGG